MLEYSWAENMKELERLYKEPFVRKEFANPADVKYAINATWLWNVFLYECERELLVAYVPMIPILNENTKLKEADYILYAHPFARNEDMTDFVAEQIRWIDKVRKPGAEIIVVGKSCDVEKTFNGEIENITYYPSHFTTQLGKRFELDIRDDSIVYERDTETLYMWPVDGCVRECKFCRNVFMKCPFESLSFEHIKSELDDLKENSPEKLKNVSFRAENLTEYGLDIYGESHLAELIDLLNSYDEIENIEVPIGLAICEISDEILEAICRCDKFTEISLNIETGSDRLLELIGKDHTRERAIHIFKEIKKAHPKVKFNTTVMLGLPTETEQDIIELAELIDQIKLDYMLVNYYRMVPKHPLADLPQVDAKKKEAHLELLLKLLKEQKRQKPFKIWHETLLGRLSEEDVAKFQKEKAEFEEGCGWDYVPKETLLLEANI